MSDIKKNGITKEGMIIPPESDNQDRHHTKDNNNFYGEYLIYKEIRSQNNKETAEEISEEQPKKERQSISFIVNLEVIKHEKNSGRKLSKKEVEEMVQSLKNEFEEIFGEINDLPTKQLRKEASSRFISHLKAFDVMQVVKDFEQATLDYKVPLKPSSEKEEPDLSQIPLWGGKIKDGSAIEWLEKHYGQWLKRYGADQNYIHRQDIKNHDEKLVQAVSNYMCKENIRARDILPTRSDLVTSNAEKFNITPEIERTTNTIQRRKYRI